MNPKYHLLVAAAALSLGACSTDDTGTDPVPQKQGYKISFTVAEDPETRTTLDAGDILRWVYTDKVGIYTVGKNVNSNALTVADVNQSPVEFIGVLENYVSPGDLFYAYYPYDAEQSTDPAAVRLSIPAEQTQTTAGVYNGQSNPLVALPTEINWEHNSYAGRISSVRFRQLGAIVELQLYSSAEALRGEKIRSVAFESDTPLAGDFQFDLTGVTVKEELPISGYESKKVTTSLEEPAAIPATGDEAARIYLTIAPGEYTGQIVVNTDAAQYTFRLTKALTFERAVIKGLPADLAKAEQTDTFIRFEDAEVERICLENWDTNGDGVLSHKEAAAVTSIGTRFKETSISSFNELRYFTGLQSIGSQAFYGRSSLTSIKLPDGVTKIGEQAFMNCSSLTSINLPDKVTQIGNYAFYYCRSLTSIDIPEGVTQIGEWAFYYCRSLTSISIPKTVSSIGEKAFAGCSSLSAFYGKYATEDNRCLIQNGTLLAFAPAGLTEYTIPDGVTAIGAYTFSYCSSLTGINIPERVTAIGSSAFAYCNSLTSVYCKPTTPPTLGGDVFLNISSSLKIYVPTASVKAYKTAANWSEWAFKIFADHAEINEDDLINFEDPIVKEICLKHWDTNGDGELSNKEAAAVTDLKQVFKDNKDIASFNELRYFFGLQSIGDNAFYGCSSLTSINLPDGVTKIGRQTFEGCSSLTSVNIPEGVTAIGAYTFWDCSSLTSVYCKPTTPPTLGAGAFYNTPSSMKIYVPAASVDAYKTAVNWSAYAAQILAE